MVQVETKKYDFKRRCPKCDGPATTKHDDNRDIIRRLCECCGYHWTELPLDWEETRLA